MVFFMIPSSNPISVERITYTPVAPIPSGWPPDGGKRGVSPAVTCGHGLILTTKKEAVKRIAAKITCQ
jgi:hypothetical protein